MIKTCLLLANLRESSVNSLKMRARVRLFRYTWGGWRDSLSIPNLAPKIVVRGLFSPMNVLQSACLFPKIFTVLAVCLACTSVAFSAPCDDDVWMVSTRGLPTICRMPLSAAIGIERLNPAVNCWERSDLQSLLDDPTRPLMIFIHGNRYSTADAKSQALQLARQAKRCCPDVAPVRTVVFSWPSEQDGILLRDGRIKYERAFADGHYFAWFLGHIEPQRPVAIMSYSFGSIITLEAFQDLVAAQRAGRSDVQPWTHRSGRTNLVFVAPAVRCDALSPRGPYRETLNFFNQLTLIINSEDRVLGFFPWIDCKQSLDALGHVGMPRSWLPTNVDFTTTNAATVIGKDHGLSVYLRSSVLARRICTGATENLVQP